MVLALSLRNTPISAFRALPVLQQDIHTCSGLSGLGRPPALTRLWRQTSPSAGALVLLPSQ
jgi:hypothetical protein